MLSVFFPGLLDVFSFKKVFGKLSTGGIRVDRITGDCYYLRRKWQRISRVKMIYRTITLPNIIAILYTRFNIAMTRLDSSCDGHTSGDITGYSGYIYYQQVEGDTWSLETYKLANSQCHEYFWNANTRFQKF
jgi:hypothetical protein